MTITSTTARADAFDVTNWRRRTGNELANQRHYSRDDGRTLRVDAIPQIAPRGVIWPAMIESATARAGSRDVVCVPPHRKCTSILNIGIHRRLARIGGYLDTGAARGDLQDANVIYPRRSTLLRTLVGEAQCNVEAKGRVNRRGLGDRYPD